MEDFLSILVLLLLGLAPTIIKLVKGEKNAPAKAIPILEEEDGEEAFYETTGNAKKRAEFAKSNRILHIRNAYGFG